jgi:hypothetical protein
MFVQVGTFNCRFPAELVIANPAQLNIKKIWHDLDKAVSNGMGDIHRCKETVLHPACAGT